MCSRWQVNHQRPLFVDHVISDFTNCTNFYLAKASLLFTKLKKPLPSRTVSHLSLTLEHQIQGSYKRHWDGECVNQMHITDLQPKDNVSLVFYVLIPSLAKSTFRKRIWPPSETSSFSKMSLVSLATCHITRSWPRRNLIRDLQCYTSCRNVTELNEKMSVSLVNKESCEKLKHPRVCSCQSKPAHAWGVTVNFLIPFLFLIVRAAKPVRKNSPGEMIFTSLLSAYQLDACLILSQKTCLKISWHMNHGTISFNTEFINFQLGGSGAGL